MSKWFALLFLIAGIGTLLYRQRGTLLRRLRLALWVGIACYGFLFGVRLVLHPPAQSQIEPLGWVMAGMAAVWLVLWLIAERRAGRPN